MLRAAAGEWISLTIRNAVDLDKPPYNPPGTATLNTPLNQIAVALQVSSNVGLHPSLLAYDITDADGMNVGYNRPQTIESVEKGKKPKSSTTYWYASDLHLSPSGHIRETPVQFV